MANINLNFYNKSGNPLNFNYIGPTGPTPLDLKFVYFRSANTNNNGDLLITESTNDYTFTFNIEDVSKNNLTSWNTECADFIDKGAFVYLNGNVAGGGGFKALIESSTIVGGDLVLVLPKSGYSGQSIISLESRIFFNASYENRPGGYFKGNIYFDPVSIDLYENEQIFIVQKFYDGTDYVYGLPHTEFFSATGPGKWRTRWYNDNYGNIDISDIIFTYKIEESLAGGDGQPLIVNYPNIAIPVDLDPADTYYTGGVIQTTNITSSALGLNVALNSTEGYDEVYERRLIVEDVTTETPSTVLIIDFYGEIVGEDERFKVLLENLGRAFYNSDSIILRDHDPKEPLPNFEEINEKRKELLITGEEIFPYIGSYKGLINALKFFGYQDLRIKEYWLNLNFRSLKLESALQQNQNFLNAIKAQQKQGYSQSYVIGDVLDNPNSGKYRMTQTYGPDKDGNYVLDVSSEETLIPSRSYKKTSLFGLYYDLNKVTDEVDEYGYPIVVDAFKFTQEEVLIKIFGLKERLKRDYLPLNARIIDITGEGVYFAVYNTRSWTDFMGRCDVELGFEYDFYPNPDFGFIEDLRNFTTRPSQIAPQVPSSYFDIYSTTVTVQGGTGSALFFSGGLPYGSTGSNPTITLKAGSTYYFNMIDSSGYNYDLTFTTDPLLTKVDPVGIINNGATGDRTITWYINPQQTTPVYYYSSVNKTLLNGVVNIISDTISDLGNSVDPLINAQQYTSGQNEQFIQSIENFYNLKQNGEIIELGDGIYDPPAYIDPITGQLYEVPIGMPVILEMFPDRWEWDELNINWDGLLIPVFSMGDRVFVKILEIFGTVVAVNYSGGTYDVLLDGFAVVVTYGENDLFSSKQNFSILNWKNIDFSNIFEIEWIIDKITTESGSPYHFEFRGSIVDFYKLAHFIPYTGKYRVTCNTYDGFNYKTSVIKNGIIVVEPKTVDIDSWTRFREVEYYLYDNVTRSWDDYDSIWEYPAEGKDLVTLQKEIPSEILDFAIYGNKSEEGQSVFVKTTLNPIAASGEIVITQDFIDIVQLYSPELVPGQYGYVIIETTTPHNLEAGDNVTIVGSIPEMNGRFNVLSVLSSTEFKIPIALQSLWSGVLIGTSPNRLYVDTSVYLNQRITGAGGIDIYVGGRLIGTAEAGDSLYNTANQITGSINSLRTYPDYFASCVDPENDPAIITIFAPSELGAEQNGVTLSVETTGILTIQSIDSQLSGGVSPTETYEFWSENNPDYPNDNLKFWGTKNIDWQIFNDNTWEDGYAHTWFDFEYNNDWLGGFELHSIGSGDNVKISTANESFPFPVGVTFGSSDVLTLQNVADALNNSSDPNITNFYYRVIPTDSGSLSPINGPINLEFLDNPLTTSSFPPPPSLIGGSPLLTVNFGYTGGTPITTTTSTTTTSTTTTSTTTTSTTTTSTTTTSTSSTTTTTTIPVLCGLPSGTAVYVPPPTTTTTTTTTTSTTTTTTTAPPTNSQISNNWTSNISGIFNVEVQIGSGSWVTVYTSSFQTITPGSNLNFFQGYYPGSNPQTGNSFRITISSASGISVFRKIQMFQGSTSTQGFFSNISSGTWRATTFSSGTQYNLIISIT
jgi:hypothetical protein